MSTVRRISAEEIERMANMDVEALQMLLLADLMEYARPEEEEEEQKRRKRDRKGRKKKKAEAKSGDCKVGKTDASSGPAAAAKADLVAPVKKKSDGGDVAGAEASGCRKKTTTAEVDLVAAAVHKAKVEEEDRRGDRKEKLKAVKKWLATGDPEARLYWKQWIAEEAAATERAYPRPVEDLSDPNAVDFQRFREFWDYVFARRCGSFEDTTAIGPMRFTDKKPGQRAGTMNTLQVFSVRVTEIKEEIIQWPIHVFGIVAARDCVDENRNIIFDRKRDNCQTITKESPYLTLTGPTRAVIVLDPASLEVVLRVKGATESEDRDLSLLALSHKQSGAGYSYVVSEVEASKLSTLELTFGHIVHSVEATISLEVIGAKLPDGFRGALTANTASIDDQKILLLAFGDDDESPAAAADGTIQLLRRVVSVELEGELRVSISAECDEGQVVEEDYKVFKPKKASRSCDVLQVCSCKLKVTVTWSLLSAF